MVIPKTVTLAMDGQVLKVSGPKGELSLEIPRGLSLAISEEGVLVVPAKKEASGKPKAVWGLYRALIANMVEGVEKGFEKKLEIEGVGFKAAVQGDELVMNLGFVNPVKIKKPEGITFVVEKNLITVSGINKQAVGQISAEIRATKKAEPYKGKGIKYQGERIRRKEGKKVVATKK